ncbi:unnamed protein product [Bemisia tabaci]|uniref:Glycine-rich selenoprotein n=2 Tax=Bemisia tabaci TaxID=7038 RepID=A0A9P0A912_BEMTA|nr:unnamed protein product [Bemisia tabaci]
MVYIAKNGAVRDTPPLMKRLMNFFWGVLNFVVMFFQTMIPGLNSGFGSSITGGSSRRGDNGGGGGGSGGWGGGSGGNGPPRGNPKGGRNVRGFGSMADIPPPPSCCGCG